MRVLFVLHNHPSISPGGTEAYALGVYNALARSHDVEPFLLARADPGPTGEHSQTPFAPTGDDPNQILAYLSDDDYDKFFIRLRDKVPFVRSFTELLRSLRPDVVHFQHALFLGRRARLDRSPGAARGSDRVHAARVPADLPPLRPAGADATVSLCTHALAAPLSRMLPSTSRRRSSSCAKRFIQVPLRATSTRSSRRAGSCSSDTCDWGISPSTDPATRTTARLPPRAASCPPSRPESAQPLRVLRRQLSSLQGRQRAACARWRGSVTGVDATAAMHARRQPRACSPKRLPGRVRAAARGDSREQRHRSRVATSTHAAAAA